MSFKYEYINYFQNLLENADDNDFVNDEVIDDNLNSGNMYTARARICRNT